MCISTPPLSSSSILLMFYGNLNQMMEGDSSSLIAIRVKLNCSVCEGFETSMCCVYVSSDIMSLLPLLKSFSWRIIYINNP